MTETYMLPVRTAALLFPALALLMFVPTAIVLYRRHGIMTRWRVLSLYGGLYYALTAFCMTIVPLPKASMNVCAAYPSFAEPQLTPGVAFADVWKEAHNHVTLDALVLHNPAFWQTVFNLVLLLPLGVFVRGHFRRGLAAATAAGFAGSLLFELTQYTGLWGLYACPYRLFAVDDLIANTAGAALGWAVAGPLAQALPELNALDDRALSADRVPFGRRLVALTLDLTGLALLTTAIAVIAHVLLGAGAVPWVPPAVFGLWFIAIPWRTGATPGKHILLLRLVTPEGEQPSPARLALRAVILSPLVALICLPLVVLATGAFLSAGPVSRPLLVSPVLCLFLIGAYVRALRRHPMGLGPHETLSGVRNHALPHMRASTRPETAAAPVTLPVIPRGHGPEPLQPVDPLDTPDHDPPVSSL